MDKKEQREKRTNIILTMTGCLLVIGLLFIYREGLVWFTSARWSDVSVISWVSISIIMTVASVLQYFFFLLLRYSVLKYFVLWFIPIIWLLNNGLVAIHRFLDWTTDILPPVGWIPLGDLLGWILSAVYLPILAASGVVIAIIDSSSAMLTQSCYYARIAMDVAGVSPWSIVSYTMNFLSVLWDLVSNSFMQEIAAQHMNSRELMEFNLSKTFSLPYWVLTIGYSLTCIIV
jgi:hypothetical protein